MNGESSAAGATGTTGSGVTRVTRVRLPDGTPVWARISGAEEATETLGRTHPLTLSARIAHAADLRALRIGQQAEKVEQEALSDLAATLGPQHVHTISARSRNRPYWDFEPQAS